MDVPDTSRVRPTASNRRRHVQTTQPARNRRRARSNTNVHDDFGLNEPLVDDMARDLGLDEPVGNEMGEDERDDDVVVEELTEPFPGGPEDPSLLKSFTTHIAASIWHNKERPLLKCLSHGLKVNEWKWTFSRSQNSKFKDLIKQSGLSALVTSSYRFVNKTVVSAFVERWQPETNTFHLSVGEMTITLDDVSTILGVPITGKSVSFAKLKQVEAQKLLVNALGVTMNEARDELQAVRGQSVRLEWLRQKFSNVSDGDTNQSITCAARAYLLYLLGCTLFVDKSATRVPVMYLSLLMNLGDVHSYAWGAAALAYLYRHLGYATRTDVKQIAGYMTLLEAWIYEHFISVRPNPNLDYEEQQPRAHRWTPRRESGSSMSNLQALREDLDRLGSHEVVWDPCHGSRDHHPFNDVAYYTGCLKCMDIVEPYHPDRVLRQFGMVQIIPPAPLAPARASRGPTASQYRIAYEYLDQLWERWYNHVLSPTERSVPVTRPWDCVPGYMDWYARRSHLVVQNPAYRSTYDPRSEAPQAYTDPQRVIEDALRISAPIVEMGVEEAIKYPHLLYAAVYQMNRVLEGQHTTEGEGEGVRVGEGQQATPDNTRHVVSPLSETIVYQRRKKTSTATEVDT